MTSLERITAAVAFENADRAPVIAQVFGHAATLAGVPLEQYIRDGETLAACQLAAWKRYGYDAVFSVMDVSVETEAVGSVLRYRDNQYPIVERYALADGGDGSELCLPNPQQAGRMPEMLRALGILRRELDNEVLVVGCVLGPFTLAAQLLGLETTLYLAIDDPPRLERLMDFATEVVIRFGQAQVRAGAHLPVVFDPAASPAVIPAPFFREFELPRLSRVFQALAAAGAWRTGSTSRVPWDPSSSITPRPGSRSRISITASMWPTRRDCCRPRAWTATSSRSRSWTALRKASRQRPSACCASFAIEAALSSPPVAKFRRNRGPRTSPRWSMQPARSSEDMPILTVMTNEIAREVPYTPGPSVRELLDAAGIRIRSGCRANGACGLCLVEIEAGEVPRPTRNECLLLSAEQRQRNTRLACQLVPDADLRIRIVGGSERPAWRDLDAALLPCALSSVPLGTALQAAYGLAVDLGTTHISLTLWDLHRGQRLCGRVGANPQSHYGSDVVTRLIAARESRETAGRIARITIDAIGEACREMCAQQGLSPAAIGRVAIVGNTSMLALLTETDPGILLQSSSWTRPVDCRPDGGEAWATRLRIHPLASIEVVPPCGGFVGSDLLAGVLATRLTDEPGGLLVDFGTNSEMAFWDGERLWVTSAAGGPAFDSYQVHCGMPAEPGAIYRVDRSPNNGALCYAVIGGGEARGVCGSGLVDLIACLRSTGELTASGRFAAAVESGFLIRGEQPAIRLSFSDVDMFQRAKGAIGAGIQTLLALAKTKAADLRRICVSGVFGQQLNCRHAQALGLLPRVAAAHVELCGNTALAGCEWFLLSPSGAAELASLRSHTTVINLSQSAHFEPLFLESLHLEPIKVDEA